MRRIPFLLGLGLLVAALGWLFLPVEGESTPDVAVHEIEEGPLRYTFHVLTGSEALFDLQADPDCLENLARTMPGTLEVMRERLLRKLGVHDLAQLRNPDDPTYRSLKGLGYLR